MAAQADTKHQYFNSIKVQLERLPLIIGSATISHFNSIKVQLELKTRLQTACHSHISIP